MPGSSSEDQLDAAALSGEQAGCIAALATSEKYIRVCRHGGRFQRAEHHAARPGRRISTAWHLQCLQEGGERLRRQETNTLREDYAARAPSLFQEFVILS